MGALKSTMWVTPEHHLEKLTVIEPSEGPDPALQNIIFDKRSQNMTSELEFSPLHMTDDCLSVAPLHPKLTGGLSQNNKSSLSGMTGNEWVLLHNPPLTICLQDPLREEQPESRRGRHWTIVHLSIEFKTTHAASVLVLTHAWRWLWKQGSGLQVKWEALAAEVVVFHHQEWSDTEVTRNALHSFSNFNRDVITKQSRF